MSVSNPEEFVKDPNVTAAVAAGIATALNVPGEWVNVTLSVVPARRQLGGRGRRLASGTVQVDYVITIPGETPVVGASSPANVTAALGSTDASVFSTAISNSVAQSAGPGAYTVVVTSVEVIASGGVASTSRAPTPASPIPAPTPAPTPPKSRGIPPVSATEDDDDTGRSIGIIVGILVAFFVLAACCLVAVLVMQGVLSLPAALGGGARQQDGEEALNVVPSPGVAPTPADSRWAHPAPVPDYAPARADAEENAVLPGAVPDSETLA